MESNKEFYEYIIVGGGIGGLYSAYLLNKIFGISSILIIEKSDRIGGRVHTIFDTESCKTKSSGSDCKRIPIELGASRITSHHKNVLFLLDKLNIRDKLVETPKVNKYYYEYDKNKNNTAHTLIDDKSVYNKIVSNIIDLVNSNDPYVKTIADNYSMYFFIEHFYDTKTAEMIKDQFGYTGDILYQSTHTAVEMFMNEFKIGRKFYKMEGGLIQIIDKLVENISNDGTQIMINNELIDVVENKHSNGKYTCKITDETSIKNINTNNIIFALTRFDLLKIPFLNTSKIFRSLNSSVMNKQLMRIYAFFPKTENNWYDDIENIISNSLIRQIKPTEKENGLIMISYSDTINAEALNNLCINNYELFKKEVMTDLRRLFPEKDIPDPIRLHYKFWETGTHIWKPSHDVDEISEKIMRPFVDKNMYIVGEVFSPLHNWMEGALISVNKLMKYLYTNAYSKN